MTSEANPWPASGADELEDGTSPPVDLRSYSEFADRYAAIAPTKPHNALYDRPATLALVGNSEAEKSPRWAWTGIDFRGFEHAPLQGAASAWKPSCEASR